MISRGVLRGWGLVLAAASVVLPALPLGPVFAQPPLPLAVLWAAYGWAAEDEAAARADHRRQGFPAAPIVLTALGLVHDQLSYNPYGLFVLIYLSTYLIGRFTAVAMSAPNLISIWGGFIVTALLTAVIVAALARFVTPMAVTPYVEAAIITALLFPLARPLYMSLDASLRPRRGGWR